MLGSILEALPFLLQTAPAIKAGYEGKNLKGQKAASGQMNQLAGRQAELAEAQTDMNNPLFQNLNRQNVNAGNADLASVIGEVSRQNRKLTTMGRKPLLDSERGGESIFRNLIKGQEDVGNNARTNTFAQLGDAQRSLGNAQNSYAGIYDAQNSLADETLKNKGLKIGANYSLGDALKNLFGLDQNSNNGNQVQREQINWIN